MATSKKNTYSTIAEELSWLENRAEEIRKYVDDNPYHLMKDRMREIMTKYGPGEMVVQTVEQQQKAIRDSLKDYASLMEVIGKLREKELLESAMKLGVDKRNVQVLNDP